jgi:hypothetical protein
VTATAQERARQHGAGQLGLHGRELQAGGWAVQEAGRGTDTQSNRSMPGLLLLLLFHPHLPLLPTCIPTCMLCKQNRWSWSWHGIPRTTRRPESSRSSTSPNDRSVRPSLPPSLRASCLRSCPLPSVHTYVHTYIASPPPPPPPPHTHRTAGGCRWRRWTRWRTSWGWSRCASTRWPHSTPCSTGMWRRHGRMVWPGLGPFVLYKGLMGCLSIDWASNGG